MIHALMLESHVLKRMHIDMTLVILQLKLMMDGSNLLLKWSRIHVQMSDNLVSKKTLTDMIQVSHLRQEDGNSQLL